MKTQLVIRDFKRTEGLENFLKSRIEECVSQFFSRTENAQLSVKAQEERHRTATRKPSFLLEVRLKLPGSKLMYHVKRTGENFNDCVEKVSNALREVMRKKHRQTVAINSRRKQLWANQNSDYGESVA